MTTLSIQQSCDLQKDIQNMWNNSIPFNAFWKSYIYMILKPKRHLRVLNFAFKVIVTYQIDISENKIK